MDVNSKQKSKVQFEQFLMTLMPKKKRKVKVWRHMCVMMIQKCLVWSFTTTILNIYEKYIKYILNIYTNTIDDVFYTYRYLHSYRDLRKRWPQSCDGELVFNSFKTMQFEKESKKLKNCWESSNLNSLFFFLKNATQ